MVKFGQWTAQEVLFPVVVELVIFKNISFHTFQGKGDGVMHSRALKGHERLEIIRWLRVAIEKMFACVKISPEILEMRR